MNVKSEIRVLKTNKQTNKQTSTQIVTILTNHKQAIIARK